MSKTVLRLGWRTKGYQLGAGVHRGWRDATQWIEEWNSIEPDGVIKKSKWRQTEYLCCDCGEPLKRRDVPCPFYFVIFTCENGHKFNYMNTD